jgi:hypothetical protein
VGIVHYFIMKEKKSSNENNKQKLGLLAVVFLSLIFGIGGGAAVLFFIQPYILQNNLNSLAVSQINSSSQDNLRQANSVIESAKKIIANQENKINDTISSSQNSLVGVFKKSSNATSSPSSGKNFNISNYYRLSDAVGEGIVVTSDGWVLTSDFTKNVSENSVLKNYVVITKDKKIYNIDKISQTGIDSYLFVHLSGAKDLLVKSFVSKMELSNGQSLVALNWLGESYLTSIVDKVESQDVSRSSDIASQNIVLSNNLGDYLDQAFIFSLDGRVVGYFDKKNGSEPLYNFQPLIKGLLQGKQSHLASLGISYVNLQEYAIIDAGYSKGALIYSANPKISAVKASSSAAVAKLQAGDIIISVDNTQIDASHDLRDILEQYSSGNQINIIYRRNGADNSVNVKLQELKQ